MLLDDAHLKTDAQKAIRDNASALRERLVAGQTTSNNACGDAGHPDLPGLVSTPDLNSAHRIFSVMNARGLDLTPSDIFKSKVIGDIGDDAANTQTSGSRKKST